MKLNIEVECTPDEARAFLGLPDLKPLQSAVLQRAEKQILDAVTAMSGENIVKSWLSLLPQASDQYAKAMAGLLRQTPPAGKTE